MVCSGVFDLRGVWGRRDNRVIGCFMWWQGWERCASGGLATALPACPAPTTPIRVSSGTCMASGTTRRLTMMASTGNRRPNSCALTGWPHERDATFRWMTCGPKQPRTALPLSGSRATVGRGGHYDCNRWFGYPASRLLGHPSHKGA